MSLYVWAASATRAMLPTTIAASSISLLPSLAHSCAGSTAASQSTTLPSIANNKASKAPMVAVSKVMPKMKGRKPAVPAHRKAKNPRGGIGGGASG